MFLRATGSKSNTLIASLGLAMSSWLCGAQSIGSGMRGGVSAASAPRQPSSGLAERYFRNSLRLCAWSMVSPPSVDRCQLDRPRRDDLVLLEQRAAHGIMSVVALLDAFEAAVAPGRAGVRRQDGVGGEDEAPAQRADGGVAGAPVRRACAGGERLDVVAVVVHARRLATHALHCPEDPAAGLVPDGGFSRHRKLLPASVAPLPFRAPGAFLQEEGVGYPRFSAGRSRCMTLLYRKAIHEMNSWERCENSF